MVKIGLKLRFVLEKQSFSTFSETDDHILNNTLEADGLYKFPVYFDPNSGAFYGPLTPERDGTSGEQYTYAIPDDGVLYVRTKMKDAPVFPSGADR